MGLFKRHHLNPVKGRATDKAVSEKNARDSVHSVGNGQSGPSLKMSMSPKPSAAKLNALPSPPDPLLDPINYLRNPVAVRQRSQLIMDKARKNELVHFTVDFSKFQDTVNYVVSIIKRDHFPDYTSIPSHSRWEQFNAGGRPRVNQLLQSWPSSVDTLERTRRLLDLTMVSVLLDGWSGNDWSYKSKESGRMYTRSEGLAVASLETFKTGFFSGDPTQPFQVDSEGLKKNTTDQLARVLQHSEQNPLVGVARRAEILRSLSAALEANRQYFGSPARPGNVLDYLVSHPSTTASSVPIVQLPTLWSILIDSLDSVWPVHHSVNNVSVGDSWPSSELAVTPGRPAANMIPFHVFTQWLCYSLMTPMEKILGVEFIGVERLTGLAEYRNGGLLIDTGLLSLKPEDRQRGIDNYKNTTIAEGHPGVEVVPLFNADDDAIVEWRALTVCILDELLDQANKQLKLSGHNALTMGQFMTAGTWKGGQEVAEVSRPNTKEPPIMISSQGDIV